MIQSLSIMDLKSLEIRKNLRDGHTMDHRGHVRCISCDGRAVLQPLSLYT
jgi:hypothetical protein